MDIKNIIFSIYEEVKPFKKELLSNGILNTIKTKLKIDKTSVKDNILYVSIKETIPLNSDVSIVDDILDGIIKNFGFRKTGKILAKTINDTNFIFIKKKRNIKEKQNYINLFYVFGIKLNKKLNQNKLLKEIKANIDSIDVDESTMEYEIDYDKKELAKRFTSRDLTDEEKNVLTKIKNTLTTNDILTTYKWDYVMGLGDEVFRLALVKVLYKIFELENSLESIPSWIKNAINNPVDYLTTEGYFNTLAIYENGLLGNV